MFENGLKLCSAGILPVCELVTCGKPHAVKHSSYQPVENIVYGNTATYDCDEGFQSNNIMTVWVSIKIVLLM